MLKMLRIAPIVTAALLAAGCLHNEPSHTLYLSSDGTVEWLTDETNVYSIENSPAERLAEEQDYLAAAAAGSTPIAEALASIGATGSVRTQIVRDTSPFRVVTAAHFDSIERVMQRLFADGGIEATASFSRRGAAHTVSIGLDFEVMGRDDEGPAAILLADLARFRFVVNEGTFIDSPGFDLQGDRVAVLSKDWLETVHVESGRGGKTELSLNWLRR
jgi:hypothetical protein